MPTPDGWLAFCCVLTMPGPRPCTSADRASEAHRMVDDEITTPTAMTMHTAADATPSIASLCDELSLTRPSSCSLPSTCSTRLMRRSLLVHEDDRTRARDPHHFSRRAGKQESIVHRTHM